MNLAQSEQSFASIAIYGYPGAGKTQLPLQFGDGVAKSTDFVAVL